MLREGDRVAGKYLIQGQLGEGGMGQVVAALHEQLQQRVAIKVLSGDHAGNPDAAARFLREARAAVRIQSEHVARVLDVAELEGGAPYMVMEFLSGKDLAAELAAQGFFDVPVAVDYLLQASEAVAEAHALGLVHRDLKPSNLFLTTRADGSPLVKVLDFGISKAMESTEATTSLTSAKALLGSPAYMSPEQARAPKTVDVRSDVWSLGVILFEFLTGETPFSGDTAMSILAATFIETTPSMLAKRPGLPQELDEVVARCLQKKADDRYQSVAEFAEALAPFAGGQSLPSVRRIQDTLQRSGSIKPPASEPKRESRPGADVRVLADTHLDPKHESAPAPARATADTVMHLSEASRTQNRPRWILLLTGGLAAALLLWQLTGSGGSAREHDVGTGRATAAPLTSAPPPAAPVASNEKTELRAPASQPVSASPDSGAAAAAALPSASAASGPIGAPKASRVAPPRAARGAPPAVRAEPTSDPLDGRR